jgi:predicted transcriptional regulator of viral defense system
MLRDAFVAVHDIAAEQFGYLTTQQARAAGVAVQTLVKMAERGTIERVAYGLYRVPSVPEHPLGAYQAATLWTLGTRAVLSHETALELLELSDVSPERIHVTLPRTYRVRREVPRRYVLHHADLPAEDCTEVEGIPVTTAARAIRDCAAAGLAPAQLRQAISDGERNGRLTRTQAEALRAALLPVAAPVTAPPGAPAGGLGPGEVTTIVGPGAPTGGRTATVNTHVPARWTSREGGTP